MRMRFVLAAALGLVLGAPALAAGVPAGPLASQPWAGAIALRDLVVNEVNAHDILAVEDHVDAMEQALANAQVTPVTSGDGAVYMLADGADEASAQLLAVAGPSLKTRVVSLPDPYPSLTLYLASYYNEIGRPQDALRILDLGLALDEKAGMGKGLGATRPTLFGERGIALMGLKRWPECLASYEAGLALPGLAVEVHARLLRGRGLALTELGRLDEAEQAYRDSLKLEPGNERALNELQYIAGLRAGKTATPVLLAPLTPSTDAPAKASPPPPPPSDQHT